MCIRDRGGCNAASLFTQYVWCGETKSLHQTWDLSIRKGGVCLLYTSDAADERSSVDLGGRRIIKKKTKIGQRGGGGK